MHVNVSVVYMVKYDKITEPFKPNRGCVCVYSCMPLHQAANSQWECVCGPLHWCLQSLVRVEDVSGEECAAWHWVWAQRVPVPQARIWATRHALVPTTDMQESIVHPGKNIVFRSSKQKERKHRKLDSYISVPPCCCLNIFQRIQGGCKRVSPSLSALQSQHSETHPL